MTLEEIKKDKRYHPRQYDTKKYDTRPKLEKRDMVIKFLAEYISDKGYSPTMQEICDSTGIKSKATVSYYLNWLKADGIIDFVPNTTRTITLTGGK